MCLENEKTTDIKSEIGWKILIKISLNSYKTLYPFLTNKYKKLVKDREYCLNKTHTSKYGIHYFLCYNDALREQCTLALIDHLITTSIVEVKAMDKIIHGHYERYDAARATKVTFIKEL